MSDCLSLLLLLIVVVTCCASVATACRVPCAFGDRFCNMCAQRPVWQMNALKHHGEVLGFHYNAAAEVGKLGGKRHWQGMSRLNRKGSTAVFAISRSGAVGSVVIVGVGSSNPQEGGRIGSTRLGVSTDKVAPPSTDKKALEISTRPYDHAGGMQVLGDLMGVPLEHSEDKQGAGHPVGLIAFWDVSSPRRLEASIELGYKVGAMGLVRLSNGRIMVVEMHDGGHVLTFYQSTRASFCDNRASFDALSFEKHSEWDMRKTPPRTELPDGDSTWPVYGVLWGAFNDNYREFVGVCCWILHRVLLIFVYMQVYISFLYASGCLSVHFDSSTENIQLITACEDGAVYLLGTHSRGAAGGTDLADLWRVDWTPQKDGSTRVEMTKVVKKHIYCNWKHSGAPCKLRAGAAPYVDPNNNLIMYAVEPLATAAGGSVGLAEYRTRDMSLDGKCGSGTAWVEMYEDDHYQGRSLVLESRTQDTVRNDNLKYWDGFGDKTHSIRFCVPSDCRAIVYEHDNFRGKSMVLTGTTGTVRGASALALGELAGEISSVKLQGRGCFRSLSPQRFRRVVAAGASVMSEMASDAASLVSNAPPQIRRKSSLL